MQTNDFSVAETPENYEQKCCCVLVLDVSGSMDGEPINELNNGLQEFYSDISNDSTTANRLEIAIVEFSSTVETIQDPSLVSNFTMPLLVSKGTTKLVDGVMEGINIIRMRKQWYKDTGQPYYRPWVILITDGAPDGDQDVAGLANEIRMSMSQGKKEFFFFAIGVKNANMQMLESISDPTMPPAQLQGLKFAEFFKWLSASMAAVANSKEGGTINMADPSNWMRGLQV